MKKESKIKLSLYFLSLWILVVSMIIFTIDVPIYLGLNWQFIGFNKLCELNILPLIIGLPYIVVFYLSKKYLQHVLNGTQQFSVKIINIENISNEHLVYLATYLIPLICFDFSSTRHLIVLLFLLIVIGVIYNKVNMFYANPSLSFFNFKVYRLDYERESSIKKSTIVITQDILKENDKIKYIGLSDKVFYGKKM